MKTCPRSHSQAHLPPCSSSPPDQMWWPHAAPSLSEQLQNILVSPFCGLVIRVVEGKDIGCHVDIWLQYELALSSQGHLIPIISLLSLI